MNDPRTEITSELPDVVDEHDLILVAVKRPSTTATVVTGDCNDDCDCVEDD